MHAYANHHSMLCAVLQDQLVYCAARQPRKKQSALTNVLLGHFIKVVIGSHNSSCGTAAVAAAGTETTSGETCQHRPNDRTEDWQRKRQQQHDEAPWHNFLNTSRCLTNQGS
jgi:hypothetical protein